MSLLKSLQASLLGFNGQTPSPSNAAPLGEKGAKTLNGSLLDRNNGSTPPRYLDNLPQ